MTSQGGKNDRKPLQKKEKKLYTSCEKFPVVLLDYSNESNNSTSQFRGYNIKMLQKFHVYDNPMRSFTNEQGVEKKKKNI